MRTEWHNAPMAMRQHCKHFQSRTYPSGDTVRKCALDLAPEAPWRCPDDCPAFAPRLADVNWKHGTLITPATPPPPPSIGADLSIAALLDEAENIVNRVAPDLQAEFERADAKRRAAEQRSGWKKLWPFGR